MCDQLNILTSIRIHRRKEHEMGSPNAFASFIKLCLKNSTSKVVTRIMTQRIVTRKVVTHMLAPLIVTGMIVTLMPQRIALQGQGECLLQMSS